MESISIIPDLTKTGFSDEPYDLTQYTGPLIIAGMAKGTESGNPAVMLALEVGEKEFLVKETTLSLFLSAADALKVKYGDPR